MGSAEFAGRIRARAGESFKVVTYNIAMGHALKAERAGGI